MKDPNQTVTWLPAVGAALQDRFSAYEDSADVDDRSADSAPAGLVSLGFIGSALRRATRLWCTIAVAGLVIGAAWYVAFPSAQKATTSVLLTDNPNLSPSSEVLTDIALAESIPVATAAVRQLGLPQAPASFAGTYTVTQISPQVLIITATAPSSAEAVRRAAAVATQFLQYRAQYTLGQQQDTDAQLQQQLDQAQQHLAKIKNQISQVSAQSSASGQQPNLTSLKDQLQEANSTLTQLLQYVPATMASTRTATRAMVQNSSVLNSATAVNHSAKKGLLLDAGGGLVAGLAVGIAIVIISAITSDRLRRRDDIAYAFGAPVRLSVVSPLQAGRRILSLPRRTASGKRDMERLVEHLRHALPGSSRGPVGLAVIAVDNAPAVARAVVELAVSSAQQRWRVAVADLSVGAHAARLLRADRPGISTVTPDSVPIVVVVPAADDVAPVGPLRGQAAAEREAQPDEPLAAACARADLVLSLVTLDPARGSEYLPTWATDVVAVISAGESTAVRIRAVGEMVRLAGVRVASVVVIGADKSDESLGAASATYQPA